MADHGIREHALWSASATARNVHCPGALTLAQFAPESQSSIFADTGTAGHQIAERCLRDGSEPMDFLGTVEKTKAHDITVDEELVNSVQEYVDYCRGVMAEFSEHWIEERFSLADLGPPFDAGGTGDFVAYLAKQRRLEIVDFKNGRGVVDVKENPQLRTYGLGALLAHPDLDVDEVTVTIVQPRAPHADGRIRSETFTVAELVDWTADLLAAMRRSKQAMDEYEAAGANSILLDEWAETWLNPGKCTFCPAEATCPKLRKEALAVAAVWFEPETDQPKIGNSALDTSPEALARDLDMIPMLEDWIKARRAYAHTQAENGVAIPGYQLAEKIGNRKWTDEAAVVEALAKEGFDEDQLYTKKPISPAQADKLLGAKRKALIEPFVERPITGTNLVSQAKTTRPPAPSKVESYFEPQN